MHGSAKTATTWKYALIGCAAVVVINAVARELLRIKSDGVTIVTAIAVSLLVAYLFIKSERRAPSQAERFQFIWQYGLVLGILFLILYVALPTSQPGAVWFPVTLVVHWLVYLIGAYLIFSAKFINKYLQELLATSLYAHGGRTPEATIQALDYDKSIVLDAEDLAESGIKGAYEEILPELQKFIVQPWPVTELSDEKNQSYSVECHGTTYEIYNPEMERESWGRATYAFFSIVNNQLSDKPVKFYAINGGNDLLGMFLTQEEYNAAIEALGPGNKQDWPYLPTLESPWYGQAH